MMQKFDTPENLAVDAEFIDWVKNGGRDSNANWKKKVLMGADATSLIEKASSLVLAFNTANSLSSEDKDQLLIQIHKDLKPFKGRSSELKRIFALTAMAAAILILILFLPGLLENKSHISDYGEVKNVRLHDGTQVDLNANSKLEVFTDDRSAVSRRVSIEGEAYFTVETIESEVIHEFIVETALGKIRVLGTQFNVSQRNHELEVSLDEGSIELLLPDNTSPIRMVPGDKITYSSLDGSIHEQNITTGSSSEWRNRLINCDGLTIEELEKFIESYYDIEVSILSPSLNNRALDGNIDNKDLKTLLDAVSFTFDLDIRYEKGKIAIDYPR